MLNLNSIMVGTTKQKELAKFYQAVFQKDPEMEENGYTGWLVGSCFFTVGEHSEMKGKAKEGARVMFNLETKEVKKEFDRIKKIPGIEIVKEPYEMSQGFLIATLADPEGNYFQLVTPWNDSKNS